MGCIPIDIRDALQRYHLAVDLNRAAERIDPEPI